MRVLVLTNMAPFVHGRVDELAAHLVRNLEAVGATAEAFRIPFACEACERLVEEMLIAISLRLWDVDRVIALTFPTYLVPHETKVLWLLHQYKQAYDLWDVGKSTIPSTPRVEELRAMVRTADNACFAQAHALYASSSLAAERLRNYNGFRAEVLMPPLNCPELFTDAGTDGYVLASGRINSSKRQNLLVRALRHAPKVRLVVAGPPDTPGDAETLRRLVAEEGVEDRVTLKLRYLPLVELAGLVNHALAVAYLPFDEDWAGHVTLEALHAGKPVLTVSDSGGVLELVRDGETGLVVEPEPEAVGAALAAFADDPLRAAQLGAAGRAHWEKYGASWPQVIERLLA
jgi:glycosyltransferase involved in cell wall biosynthesis